MNRITNAFSAAIPSANSETSSIHHKESPHISSPLEPPFPTHLSVRTPNERRFNAPSSVVYDDPRSIYYPPLAPLPSYAPPSLNRPSRPTLLRHLTDEGLYSQPPLYRSASSSQAPTPRARSESRERSDRGVRVNLMAAAAGNTARKGWGMSSATGTTRMNRMAEGPSGRYAVGGGQYLRVFHIDDPSSGSSTPVVQEYSSSHSDRNVIARGPGGATISEVVNLWKSSWPVGKGVNDLDWGVAAWDHKLVTATPSGNFMLYDVERGKLDKEISSGSFRPLNCATFCHQPAYCHMVLIGGADGNIKLLDLRTGDPPSRRPLRHSSAITSLCFSPTDASAFVIGLDDGTIKRYDWRMAGKHMGTAYGAHGSKAVMDLKWKVGDEGGGESGGWLASAGANKIVQIWDMNQSWEKAPSSTHSLYTPHPIRRIAWRPNHSTELLVVPVTQPLSTTQGVDPASSLPQPTVAPIESKDKSTRLNVPKLFNRSSSQVSDGPTEDDDPLEDDDAAHLSIWHVRRHHVAKYNVPTQDGVAIDAAWRDEGSLVVTFQNGGLAQLDVERKIHPTSRNASGQGRLPVALPLDQVPRQVSSWSSRGEMAFAVDRFKAGEIPFDDLKPEYSRPVPHPYHVSQISDPPYHPIQTIGSIPLHSPLPSPPETTFMAKWYRMEGGGGAELCRWNAGVAAWVGREDDARLWVFMAGLFEEFKSAETHAKAIGFEDVWQKGSGQAKEKRPTTSRNVSPKGGHARLSESQGPASQRQTPKYTSIALQRFTPPPSPLHSPERSTSSLPSSSSDEGSEDDSEEEIESWKPKSRFVTFMEPQTQVAEGGLELKLHGEAMRRDSSGSSQGSPVFERKGAGESSPIAIQNASAAGQGNTVGGSLSGSLGARKSLSRMFSRPNPHAHSHHHPHKPEAAFDFYPDPYGIIPDQPMSSTTLAMPGTGGTTTASGSSGSYSGPGTGMVTGAAGLVSRASTRSSPVLAALGLGLKPSPRMGLLSLPGGSITIPTAQPSQAAGLASHEYGSGITEAPLAGRGSGEGATIIAPGANGVGVNSRVGSGSMLGKEMRGREEKFEKSEWEEYKRGRMKSLETWWDACVDNGEVQLAATIALIAQPLHQFPPFQLERIAHAYADALESLRLPLPASYIRRFSGIPSLEVTAQDQGVTHTLGCDRCSKSTGSLEDIGVEGKVFWWCKKCKMGAKECAVCRKVVKGMWMGCRKCSHGGHHACMRLYHSQATLVPFGKSPTDHTNHHQHQQGVQASHISFSSAGASSGAQSINASTAGLTSGYDASAVSGYTHSGTDVSSTDVDGDGMTEPNDESEPGLGDLESNGGFALCPAGCGCQCRKVGPLKPVVDT
ncbi:hypothetical protein L202_07913 [Cryptococcus amylolentus CBS 6039]|uniref:Uncharacterized protein n=3 Tax=Cryptococcus amylolentus CBS 6039 TaxID=1295533 RepID=A0A1E3HAL3_9TREE|nr:hypothetical protein L202_07913 [Cryptococcus amylolentus CBS 6039]ODN73379.1 hypothetical protein L202_07913 [Cryptococcus amylolentus CBS 6039]